MTNPFTVGETLVSTWGYEQTNVEFWQITRTTPCTVTVAPLRARTSEVRTAMSETVIPDLDTVTDKRHTARVLKGKPRLLRAPHGASYMRPWDGSPVFSSSWG